MDPQVQGYVVVVTSVFLLAVIATTLIVIAIRRRPVDPISVDLMNQMRNLVAELGKKAQENIDITAILALANQLRDDPMALRRVPEFSRSIVGAVLVFLVNAIASDIKVVQEELSENHHKFATISGHSDHYRSQIDLLTTQLDELKEALAAANRAAQEFEGKPADS